MKINSMGEAPTFVLDDQPKSASDGFDLVCRNRETTTIVGNTKYVIGDFDDSTLSIGVKVFDGTLENWVYPTVLGTKPTLTSHLWARPLGEDRVLVINKYGAITDDNNVWILEVDTPYVRQQKKLLGSDHVVAWSKAVLGYVGKPKHIIISGPSSVGKGTLISKLMKEFPSMFGFSVSHTTRAPREQEIDGIHYHFTDQSLMEEGIKEGKFIEFVRVHDNLYGTSIEAVQVVAEEGKRCILDIDIQGSKSVSNSPLDMIFIFIRPPSYEDLEKRLRFRGTETEEQIQKLEEQERSPSLFDHVLVNDDLNDCYQTLKNLFGLHESVDNMKADFPLVNSVSKVSNKIYFNPTNVDLENVSKKNSFVLDVSSIKGGAPGRTSVLELICD